jgi:hypothetical protein
MTNKTLNGSIAEALTLFFEANGEAVGTPPEHLVEAIREEVEPALDKYKSGACDHEEVGAVIRETAIYVLRDMTDEETKQYASLMYGAIGAHGHFDK